MQASQLSPDAILVLRKGLATLRVDLLQTVSPIQISDDSLVGGGQEIAMPRIVVVPLKTDRRGLTITQAVRQAVGSGILFGPMTQLTTKQARAAS